MAAMLPLVRPAMVIAAIQNVVPIGRSSFFPLIFIQNDDLKTLPQGLTSFMGEYTTNWGVLFAGLTLSAAPIIVIYIVLSRQFINGMTQGAIKSNGPSRRGAHRVLPGAAGQSAARAALHGRHGAGGAAGRGRALRLNGAADVRAALPAGLPIIGIDKVETPGFSVISRPVSPPHRRWSRPAPTSSRSIA